jgi:hypothetical protein
MSPLEIAVIAKETFVRLRRRRTKWPEATWVRNANSDG